jgi:hypothetical protein
MGKQTQLVFTDQQEEAPLSQAEKVRQMSVQLKYQKEGTHYRPYQRTDDDR